MRNEEIPLWHRRKIGKNSFINETLDRPSRKEYINFVKNLNVKSILEIGPGEGQDAEKVLQWKKIKYCAVDVSEVFLKHCSKIEGLSTTVASMDDLPFGKKEFTLVYARHVLEHSSNIRITLNEMRRVSNRYFIVMFKWRWKSGGIKSKYRPTKGKIYSTAFKLSNLLEQIKNRSKSMETMIMQKTGKTYGIKEYAAIRPKDEYDLSSKKGNDLIITGVWK